jgi:ribosomal protein S18 acetylase RimI-like enzyme
MARIREATWDDSDIFLIAAEDYANAMNRGCQMIDVDYASTHLIELLMSNGRILVCEHEGDKVGLVGAIITVSPFNPNTEILQEIFWWTDNAYRNLGVGTLLLEALELEANKLGIQNISMALIDTSPKIEHWLAKRGYNKRESSYLKTGG